MNDDDDVDLARTLSLSGAARAANEPDAGDPSVPEGTTVGRYTLLCRLGGGGGGVVYSAYDPELDRKIAVKLLRAIDVGDRGAATGSSGKSPARHEAQTRLLREAQAMAKLSHPNVVPVFDAGTHEERVFVAMELVEAGSLRTWLREPRSRAEILRVFLEAGEGLAAAHDAGFVHRDFKPDNVLLGADGRARVTDFGLVQARVDAEPASLAPAAPSPSRGRSGASTGNSLSLTEVGAVMGTPPYMAPEQHDARPTDARSDQYSFCVALWEALSGERLFVGSYDEIAAAKRAFVMPTMARGGGSVPPWIRRVLARGLSADPDARFPAMRPLLDALRSDPPARRRRAVLGIAAAASVVAAVIGTWAFASHARVRPCVGEERLLVGAWDDATKARARAGIAAAGAARPELLSATVEQALDRYARAWVGMRTESCEATRLRGEQSERVLVLRTACLDGRLRELRAFATALATADMTVAQKAPQAATQLTDVAACGDVAALTEVSVPPTDPATAAAVESVRHDLAEAKALRLLGKQDASFALTKGALDRASAATNGPARAEALLQHGLSTREGGEYKAAAHLLVSAFATALQAHHDAVAAEAATELVDVQSYRLQRPADARSWAEIARAAIERSGGTEEARASLMSEEAWIRVEEENGVAAVPLAEQAAATAERLFGGESLSFAPYLSVLGGAYDRAHRYDDAQRAYERLLALFKRSVGEEHPAYANTLGNLGTVAGEREDFEASAGYLERSLALQLISMSARHPSVMVTRGELGAVRAEAGQCDKAVPILEDVVAYYEAEYGGTYGELVTFLLHLGSCYRRLGRRADALTTLERSLRIASHEEAEPSNDGRARFELARVLTGDGSAPPRAIQLATEAKALLAKVDAPKRLAEVEQWLADHPAGRSTNPRP